jgi:cell wall assembly regulator SMI1
MSAFEALQALVGRTYRDEEGEPFELTFYPPCSKAEIAQFEARLPCPLPEDIREMLAFSRGFEGGPIERVEFLGEDGVPEHPFFCPIDIMPDGFGNAWVIDLTPDTKEFGPISFWCHDPPVFAYQCASLREFLVQIRRLCESPEDNPIEEVRANAVFELWGDNSHLISQPEAAESADGVLRAFAQTLGPDWRICDLRRAKTGDGFAWGHRDLEEVKRHGTLPIFACQDKPKRSLIQRLLGRKG